MVKKTWNKGDVLPKIDSKEYKQLLDELEKNTKFIEDYRIKLIPEINVKEFMNILNAFERIDEITRKFGEYAYMWFSEDTSNQEAKNFRSKVEQLCVNVGNRVMYFSLWFKNLDDKNAQRIINGVPKDYKYYLEYLRILKHHILTEPEEKIINIKDITGTSALIKVYDVLTNDFVFKLKVDGKEKELTREQLSTYARGPDAKLRKEAYQEMHRVYGKSSDVLCEVYKNVVLDWKNENIDLRKYTNAINVRNKGNDVSDKAIDILLNVCRKNIKLFQEYFKLKAKVCGIKDFSRYDVYAPYSKKKMGYSYENALEIVYSSYKAYSEEMYKLAKKVTDSKHVDYEIRKNKMCGAYCMEMPCKIVPYVLLNYDKDLRNLFTIAHELGHAIHDQLAENHSILVAHPPLILAETASVFGETLLFENLMKNSKDKELKKSLLVNQLDSFYATIIRQSYFIMFEIKAHEMVAKGEADLNKLNNEYLNNLKEQFGNSVKVPEEFKHEWSAIPHIYHSPFYCYAYTFGNLLVLALYEKYKKEGKSFVPKYLKLLSYGGSEKPAKVLKEIGIDIEDEKFWQGGFDLVKEMVEELKRLV